MEQNNLVVLYDEAASVYREFPPCVGYVCRIMVGGGAGTPPSRPEPFSVGITWLLTFEPDGRRTIVMVTMVSKKKNKTSQLWTTRARVYTSSYSLLLLINHYLWPYHNTKVLLHISKQTYLTMV